MKCGHLFNGIGGFGLAASWMGWENVMHCEIDPFCNKVMNYHFPNSYQHEDIRTTDFTIWRGELDLITGGFPCQPYSAAGKRKGKEDDRHLWPEMLRAIREIQPGWIVGENVRGLTNWNGGLVFDEVQADLETEGYEVLPFLLPAAGVNAPHRRDRIWFVANRSDARVESVRAGQDKVFKSGTITNPNSNGINRRATNSNQQKKDEQERDKVECETSGYGEERVIADASNIGLEGRLQNGNSNETGCGIYQGSEATGRNSKTDWANFPTQSPVCGRNDGVPSGLAYGTVHSKSGTRKLKGKQAYGKWRKESIKALGNSVVPQVVYQIFKAIEQYESRP